MSFTLALYLVDVTHSIGEVFVLLAIACSMGAVGFGLGTIDAGSDTIPKLVRYAKALVIAAVIFMLSTSLIPSKTTMYAMIGVQAAKVALESPEGKEITDKVIKIVNSKLDTLVKEAK